LRAETSKVIIALRLLRAEEDAMTGMRGSISVVALGMTLGVAGFGGCGGTTDAQTRGSGGAATGGSIATGGTVAIGGSGATGGMLVTGGTVATGGSGGGWTTSCVTATDCVWGEIDHEILQSTDCTCLFGCPSLIQNVATRDRRQTEYSVVCTPGYDGQGNPCPIDDCMMPPPLECVAGECSVVSVDGGA
jgi:hypothetical protein